MPMPLPGALDPSMTLSSLQPKTPFRIFSLSADKRRLNIIRWQTQTSRSGVHVVKCSSSSDPEGGGGDMKNTLSGMVDKRVEELLGREENKELLDKLNQASERVELARNQLADIQRQELEAQQMRLYIDQLESRASEIAECQQEVLEAKAMVEEAERFLSISGEISKDEERLESVKAASISALVGTLAGLPIYLSRVSSSPQLLLQLGITFASCALFGLTFRYAVRRDLDNIQLKTGTSAAFAIVKGLATLNGGPPLELSSESFLSHALDGASFVIQDLFIFIFAAVSLDFCFKMRIVSPFPIERSD